MLADRQAYTSREQETTTAINEDDVVRLRAVIGRLSRQLNGSVADVGMSPTQLSVLGSVNRRGPLGIGELADLEGINPTMLSRIVGKLTDAGFIARTPSPDDGRAVLVQVTAAGRKVHQRAQAQRTRLLAARLQSLSATQADELVAALPALEVLAARTPPAIDGAEAPAPSHDGAPAAP